VLPAGGQGCDSQASPGQNLRLRKLKWVVPSVSGFVALRAAVLSAVSLMVC
jgi:hypothetical protein